MLAHQARLTRPGRGGVGGGWRAALRAPSAGGLGPRRGGSRTGQAAAPRPLLANCYTRRMPDSIPAFTDSSFAFIALGAAGIVAAVVALCFLSVWHQGPGHGLAHVRETPRRKVVAQVVAVAASVSAVFSFIAANWVGNAADAREAVVIAEAWDLAPRDAEALAELAANPVSETLYVEIDGEAEPVRLQRQDDRLLLLREDDTVIPVVG